MNCRSICAVTLILVTFLAFASYVIQSFAVTGGETGFWIWSGRDLSSLPGKLLYIHQGTVDRNGRIVMSGAGPIALPDRSIFIVVRLEQLIDSRVAADLLTRLANRWSKRGTSVRGVQLDFDSPTDKLDSYVSFVAAVRKLLSPSLELSVTGLADWASQGEEGALRDLGAITDEIVFQLYTGRTAIRDLDRYVRRLLGRSPSLALDFKIGLLPGMEQLPEVQRVLAHSRCKGAVYFLLERVR